MGSKEVEEEVTEELMRYLKVMWKRRKEEGVAVPTLMYRAEILEIRTRELQDLESTGSLLGNYSI